MAKKGSRAVGSIVGVGQATLGKHLDISQVRVAQFVADGTFLKLPNGKLDKDDCRIRYIRWLRDETRKSSQSVSASRVQTARAEKIEQEIARDRRDLIPADEVCDFLTETVGTFRSELAGVPAASTRDPDIRAVMEKNLDAAVDRLGGSFGAAEANVRSRRPLVVEAEEADA